MVFKEKMIKSAFLIALFIYAFALPRFYSQEPAKKELFPESVAQLRIDSAPTILLLGTAATIHGIGFDGSIDNTEISMGGKKITPFAESPVTLKYKIPQDLNPGFYTVIITEKFKEPTSFPVLCIKLDLTSNRSDLRKGESIKGKIQVEGTEKPLVVELINDSPSEIAIDPRLVIVKGGIGEFEIKGLKPGSFRIHVGVVEFLRK